MTSIRGDSDLEIVITQMKCDQLGDVVVVLDHEYPSWLVVGAHDSGLLHSSFKSPFIYQSGTAMIRPGTNLDQKSHVIITKTLKNNGLGISGQQCRRDKHVN
jgi:hypothetical protein